MKYGIFFHSTSGLVDLPELATHIEDRGFESIFLPEHSHLPQETDSKHPQGGPPPSDYGDVPHPFIALAAVASVTTRLRLGTAVSLVVERDPIWMAKEIATLDVLSSGRVELGVGAGWNHEEMRNHGTDPDRRYRVLRERVEAMTAMWQDDISEYNGELVTVPRIRIGPKPVQSPRPPVHIGGFGPNVIKRVLRYADGWLPTENFVWDSLPERVNELREGANRLARPRPIVSVLGQSPTSELGVTPNAESIAYCERAGVDRCILRFGPGELQDMRPQVDRAAQALGL